MKLLLVIEQDESGYNTADNVRLMVRLDLVSCGELNSKLKNKSKAHDSHKAVSDFIVIIMVFCSTNTVSHDQDYQRKSAIN